MVILQILDIFGHTFLAVFEALLSLFPIYEELNGPQDQIIAAAVGVPVIVVSLVGTGIGIVKFIIKRV